MRLSNLADYAVVLMSAAARQCGSVALSAGMLAEQTGIPGPTAQKLVSGLARAGLLVASRGSGGGIRLARPAAAISVADIIEAVEGPIALTACRASAWSLMPQSAPSASSRAATSDSPFACTVPAPPA